MKEMLENGKVRLYPSDWRYSAAIVGLCYFFDYWKIDYGKTEDYIEYTELEIDEDFKSKYLLFVEYYFSDRMHHRIVEDLLKNGELSEADEKLFREKLKANKIMQVIFKDIKYSNETADIIQKLINENRNDLIEKTFVTGDSLYAKYIKVNKKQPRNLLGKSEELCRLLGYYEDTGRKSKSLAYNFSKDTFVYEDELEFDFIPFAFSKTRESFFINNNISIDGLVQTQKNLQNSLDDRTSPRQLLFQYKKSINNLDFSVEIISKTIEKEYFETIYVRDKALEIFKKIDERTYEKLTWSCKYDDEYIDIQKCVTDSIINNIYLDELILKLFKEKVDRQTKMVQDHSHLQWHLIKINSLIYGGENMDDKITKAKKTAYVVKLNLEENKLKSYRQKLISALTFNDYDRFCKVLLQLSDYSGVIFDFAYDLFDDFESNKNVAFAFVNGLNVRKDENGVNNDGSVK